MARVGGRGGNLSKDQLAEAVAKAVGAGKVVAVETVDFNDPNRPKTCIEVDFPIIPVNQVAIIEGNAGKPIYQMSKWWARRRSSVFRSMLLAAAMKAPDDPAEAAKAVWDVYYANHQKRGALKNIKVADIFMGGGTTIVEGSRLGMKMFGTDLNPVAWFVVKNELAKVDPEAVKALLAEIEAEVKPQIMPFYACDCPRGHKGTWTNTKTGKVMGKDFDPLALKPEERKDYRYEGPETIYVFWAKHGPCQVKECGHRTPIMSSPVIAVKTLTVRAWKNHSCPKCRKRYDIEEDDARMAPGVPLVVAESETPFAVLDAATKTAICPHCGKRDESSLGKPNGKKKVALTLLIHPNWLKGAPRTDKKGNEYGGSAVDSPEATARWNEERARTLRLVEVRGELPEEVTCPETKVTFSTKKGTVPKKSTFTCQAKTCGREQDILDSVGASGKSGPLSPYAIQGFCPKCASNGMAYGGRFFAAVRDTTPFDLAESEWNSRSIADLTTYWPRTDLPEGLKTTYQRIPEHGFPTFQSMFNARQLLVHTQLLRAIVRCGGASVAWDTREYVLGAFQQYLRNQCLFTLWNPQRDSLEPHFSNNNYYPKNTVIENCVFPPFGRGNWNSSTESLFETYAWATDPWEIVSNEHLTQIVPVLAGQVTGKSEKVSCGDPIVGEATLANVSATELSMIDSGSYDLVITDPPFGNNIQYSELADFFYVWLRLVLQDKFASFKPQVTPKHVEAVVNRVRAGNDADAFYQRILTECWREAYRILKPGGILAFTFHHSEDDPWIAVLESIFEAGFYLEATYPIRSDETKGEGAKPGTFGSQIIEYDIIHVCRKRTEEPKPVSWGKMRREVLEEVKHLQSLLEHHAKAGLQTADLQVIKRGKALEYFSRHYGKVFYDETRTVSVREALLGINQLIDEDAGKKTEAPPATAEPFTRQFLRIFGSGKDVARDQMQKFLRGTGIAPSEFEERGWCVEEKKIYRLVPPLDFAREWHGKHRRNMTDLDQTLFLIGASFDGSGINVSENLRNDNFRPHPALGALLDWHSKHAAKSDVRTAAARARALLHRWEESHRELAQQLSLWETGES